uniref:LOB domain-containing protein n=1 Tax=Kalanchoe fedtschenkoi TaxID=63787 RepID=A0A7N0U006_KALFE
MTLKGGTSQACAACKYQRRRCLPECQLAPYFPADQPKMFQNAHRLFGVSNILKILKQLDPSQKSEAMRSIIYQSDIRDKYPVAGCFGYIHQLHYQIQRGEEELHAIRSQIALCKMQQQQQTMGQNDDDNQIMQTMQTTGIIGEDEDSTSLLQLGMGPPNNTHNNNISSANNNINNNNTMMFENGGGYVNEQFCWNNNNNLMDFQLAGDVVQQQFAVVVPSSSQEMGAGINNSSSLVHHFREMHPFLDAIDDRQSFIDSKVAYESSSSEESSDPMKAMDHQVVESTDLKNAAACFSLTSVN